MSATRHLLAGLYLLFFCLTFTTAPRAAERGCSACPSNITSHAIIQ
jgi:hypothetical protein